MLQYANMNQQDALSGMLEGLGLPNGLRTKLLRSCVRAGEKDYNSPKTSWTCRAIKIETD